MRDVDRLKEELAEAVKNSDEYKDFIRCRNALEENPQLKNSVNELRKYSYLLQNTETEKDLFDDITEVRHTFEYVHSQNMANDYLRAELCLCRMVQDICNSIVKEIEIDLDFMK